MTKNVGFQYNLYMCISDLLLCGSIVIHLFIYNEYVYATYCYVLYERLRPARKEFISLISGRNALLVLLKKRGERKEKRETFIHLVLMNH